MKDFYLKPQLCPECGHQLDGHTNTTGNSAPEPGDFSVCIRCATVLTYGDNMQVRKIAWLDLPAECQQQVAEVVMAVKTVNFLNPDHFKDAATKH